MIRHATLKDLNCIDDIAVRVIMDMKASNIPQWNESYPRKEHYQKDVLINALFVYEINSVIYGAVTILPEQDPPYETITGWRIPHGQSLVVHRLIVDPDKRQSGVARSFIEHAIRLAQQRGLKSIKIDTHHDNYKMRNFLEKHGFQYIGYLKVINREAYELLLEDYK
jgi:ribosomal protein S18 acetylase RimI-like enzyme